MSNKLLILGTGSYALVAKEVAESMGCFEKIAFLDDRAVQAPDGSAVLGKISDLKQLSADFTHAFVAIGNPTVRASLISKIESETSCRVATLLSPHAYIAPSAEIAPGCIVEPMAVIHSKCVLEKGCIISAGTVINHYSRICAFVHLDCNVTVSGFLTVTASQKIQCGTVVTNDER